jgi:hypothetical protein
MSYQHLVLPQLHSFDLCRPLALRPPQIGDTSPLVIPPLHTHTHTHIHRACTHIHTYTYIECRGASCAGKLDALCFFLLIFFSSFPTARGAPDATAVRERALLPPDKAVLVCLADQRSCGVWNFRCPLRFSSRVSWLVV